MAEEYTTRLGLYKAAKGDAPGTWAAGFSTGADNAEARFMKSGAGPPMTTGGVSLVAAEFAGQRYFDTTNEVWWTCRTLGAIGVSVWVTTEHNIGDIKFTAYDPSSPPKGWLACGQGYDTTTYALLFEVIGYDWGGSGATFQTPPNERVPAGASGSGDWTLCNTVGVDEVTLDESTTPAHNHGSAGAHKHKLRQSDAFGLGSEPNVQGGDNPDDYHSDSVESTGAHTHTSFGGGLAHENRQRTMVVGLLIFAAES